MNLKDKHCASCEGEIEKLTKEQAQDLMPQIPQWTLSEAGDRLTRTFGFKDFAKALAFVNEVGKLAEEQWHHPDISFGWGKVEISLMTHSIGGLAENDFILASKIDTLPQ
jgi:4a-hydroxytetrahydrobiopterin dehydratase